MRIELEIPDFEALYYTYDNQPVTGTDVKKALVNFAVEKFIDQLYNDHINDKLRNEIVQQADLIAKERSDEIVDKVIERVYQKILAKKAIVNEMPKKTEIANINKEWESYFLELIDKAIAKRFK